MFASEKVTEDVQTYFLNYAAESYALGIPMAEAIYALILMRRHIWLYADFQMIFSFGIDQQQALDTLNRTILLFDYATYDVTREYQRLMKVDMAESIKLLNTDRFEKAREFFRQYAETSFNNKIPLHESVYALNMMRRYMWLNPDFQDMFIHALAHHQAVDSLMSVMLLMDHAVHDVTRYYHERLEDKP